MVLANRSGQMTGMKVVNIQAVGEASGRHESIQGPSRGKDKRQKSAQATTKARENSKVIWVIRTTVL